MQKELAGNTGGNPWELCVKGRGLREFGRNKAAPRTGAKCSNMNCPASGGGKPRPGLHKGKAPGITSSERHKGLASVGCHMTCQQDQVTDDGTNSAAFYSLFLIGLMLQRLLPDHAKQIVGNDRWLQTSRRGVFPHPCRS